MSALARNDKIFVAGHRGLIGRALVSNLQARGYSNLVMRSRAELDLLEPQAVLDFLKKEKPKMVFVAAAKVGGILANNLYRADFAYQNLQIQNNVIWGSHQADVERLVFLGSSCIYPKEAPQPMQEKYLLTGPLEETNRPYAIAKIAGMELVTSLRRQYKRKYFSVMPTNLYGPGDNFDPETSHVLPALIQRFAEARAQNKPTITIWGSGKPRREFLYSEDCADAIVHLAETLPDDYFERNKERLGTHTHINVGFGSDVSIAELAEMVAKESAYQGQLLFDQSKPDGTFRKLLDCSILQELGWAPKTDLRTGIHKTSVWFSENSKRN